MLIGEMELLVWVATVELILLVALSIWYLIQGWWATRIVARREVRFSAATESLSAYLAGQDEGGERHLSVVKRLSRSEQISLLANLAALVSRNDRTRIRSIAADLGLLRRAERRARSRWWWKRLEAVRFLAAIGSDELSPVEFLHDPRLEIRAEAVEWAGDLADPAIMPDLIEVLGDESGLCRYSVQDALLDVGHPAVAPLAAYLEGERTPTQVLTALTVTAGIGESRLLDPVLRVSHHELAEIRAGAARTLGAIGGDRAATRLRELANDSDGDVRAAAIDGLAVVEGPAASALIADALTDEHWNVRRAAGLALRGMGAPGRLLLRNARRSVDRFARDMATLVLELPPEPHR